ncbi:MAG: hypothetical protein AAFN92_21845, partial [Bacteroidota bacterium]
MEIHYRVAPGQPWRHKRIISLANDLQTPVNNIVLSKPGLAYLATKSGMVELSWSIDSLTGTFAWKAVNVLAGDNFFSLTINPQRSELAFAAPSSGVGTVPLNRNGKADFKRFAFDSSHIGFFGIQYLDDKKLWGWSRQQGVINIQLPLGRSHQAGKVVSSPGSDNFRRVDDFSVVHDSGAKLRLQDGRIDSFDVATNSWSGQPPAAFRRYINGEIDYLRYLGDNVLVAAFNSTSVRVFYWDGKSIVAGDTIDVGTDILSVSNGTRDGEFWIGTPIGLYHSIGEEASLALGSISGINNFSISAIVPWKDEWLVLGSELGVILYHTVDQNVIRAGKCHELLNDRVMPDRLALEPNSEVLTFQ